MSTSFFIRQNAKEKNVIVYVHLRDEFFSAKMTTINRCREYTSVAKFCLLVILLRFMYFLSIATDAIESIYSGHYLISEKVDLYSLAETDSFAAHSEASDASGQSDRSSLTYF